MKCLVFTMVSKEAPMCTKI